MLTSDPYGVQLLNSHCFENMEIGLNGKQITANKFANQMLSVLTPGNCSGSPGPSDSEGSMTKFFSDTRNRAAMEGGALPTTAKTICCFDDICRLARCKPNLIAHSWNASNNS